MAFPCSPAPHPVRTLLNRAGMICRQLSLNHPEASAAQCALFEAAREIEALEIPALPSETLPTPNEVVESYAKLRNALTEVRDELDPEALADHDEAQIGTHIEHAHMVALNALEKSPDSWAVPSAIAPSEVCRDELRMDWIIDNAVMIGGGSGMEVKFRVPDSECIRSAIDEAREGK